MKICIHDEKKKSNKQMKSKMNFYPSYRDLTKAFLIMIIICYWREEINIENVMIYNN